MTLLAERTALETMLWEFSLANDQAGFDSVRAIYCDLLEDEGDPGVPLLRREISLSGANSEIVIRFTWPDIPMLADLYSTKLKPFYWLLNPWLTVERDRKWLHVVSYCNRVDTYGSLKRSEPHDLLELLRERGLLP